MLCVVRYLRCLVVQHPTLAICVVYGERVNLVMVSVYREWVNLVMVSVYGGMG